MNSKALILVLLVLLLTSCQVTKRVYRKGYNIQWVKTGSYQGLTENKDIAVNQDTVYKEQSVLITEDTCVNIVLTSQENVLIEPNEMLPTDYIEIESPLEEDVFFDKFIREKILLNERGESTPEKKIVIGKSLMVVGILSAVSSVLAFSSSALFIWNFGLFLGVILIVWGISMWVKGRKEQAKERGAPVEKRKSSKIILGSGLLSMLIGIVVIGIGVAIIAASASLPIIELLFLMFIGVFVMIGGAILLGIGFITAVVGLFRN